MLCRWTSIPVMADRAAVDEEVLVCLLGLPRNTVDAALDSTRGRSGPLHDGDKAAGCSRAAGEMSALLSMSPKTIST